MIMDTTASWLENMINAGGSVILIDSTAEVPGAVVVETEGLADALVAAVDLPHIWEHEPGRRHYSRGDVHDHY
jgi:hypothetical protein